MALFASPSGLLSLRAEQFPTRPTVNRRSLLGMAIRAIVLLGPTAILAAGAWKTKGLDRVPVILVLGALFQLLFLVFLWLTRASSRQPRTSPVFFLYPAGWTWMWLAGLPGDDYFVLGRAALVLVGLSVVGLHILLDSGVAEARRAQQRARQLAHRKNWPAETESYRMVPEVEALREAIESDPGAALALLSHPQVPVRLGALAALEFRKSWRQGQPQFVLQVARQVQEPAVRAGAIRALGRVEDRTLVEDLAEFLRDPSRRVRQATVEALLSEGERRWSWIRHAVRRALADITLQDDGPLVPRGRLLPPEAVKDLTAWAGEKGILSVRASATLGAHYERALNEQPGEALILEFRRILADPHRPAPLRLELTQLLQKNHLLDRDLQEKLLDPLNPAPLRLLAAEALLSQGEHEGAVAALRDIARLPNREIGLATAEVIQRWLGVDLGLPVGQPLPAVHTRQAAEVTRRVMTWATGGEHPEGQGHSGTWARPENDSSVRSRPVI